MKFISCGIHTHCKFIDELYTFILKHKKMKSQDWNDLYEQLYHNGGVQLVRNSIETEMYTTQRSTQ